MIIVTQCALCHVHSLACMLWTSQANTNVEKGRQSNASSLQDCQAACVDNTLCNGLDWIPAAAEGQRCWLSGPWSGSRYNGVTWGVTHYDFDKNCPGNCGVSGRILAGFQNYFFWLGFAI